MVEPTEFSEIYNDAVNIDNSFNEINTICQQAFYCNRFHINKVKKLNKYLDKLKDSNEAIKMELERIQSGFDSLDTQVIIFIHNIERVKTELTRLSELQEEELNKMKITDDIVEKEEKESLFNAFNS